MKRNHIISLIVLLCWVAIPSTTLSAKPREELGDWVWSSHANKRTGRYAERTINAQHTVSLHVDGLYYYGDVEPRGWKFFDDFTHANLGLQIGGSYTQHLTRRTNMRYSLYYNYVGAKDNSVYRMFDSHSGKAALGVEWHPFIGKGSGFYLYGGAAVQLNGVRLAWSTEENEYLSQVGDYKNIKRSVTYLPMVVGEIGYNFKLGTQDNWLLGVHVGLSYGLIDEKYINLDGWPTPSHIQTPNNKWSDGYYSVGLTLSYTWKQCKQCRLERHDPVKRPARSKGLLNRQ